MPLVNKSNKSYQETSSNTEKQNKKPIVIDPFDPTLKLEAGKKSKLDPEDDPFTRLAPPPKGRYQLKCFMQKDGFTKGEGRDGNLYYSASIECRVVGHSNPDYNDTVVFPRAFYSSVSRGHKISTMAAMIVKWGYGSVLEKANYEVTESQVFKLFAQILQKEPTCYADLDWEGQYNAGTKESPDYQRVFNSMEDFPMDDEGNPIHNPIISDGKGGTVEINARLKVVQWIGKSNVEEKKAIKVQEVEKEEVVETKAAGKANGKAVSKKKEPEPVEEVVEEVAEVEAIDEELVVE